MTALLGSAIGPRKIKLVAIVACIAAVVIAAIVLMFHHRRLSFDSEKWRIARMDNDSRTLLAMSEDLVARLYKDRPAKAQVIQMLGEPDVKQEVHFEYALGEGAFISGGWSLDIYFNLDRVVKIHLHAG